MIKSFRGNMANGDQETIRLSTNKGLIGYKITKFQVMPINANTNCEGVYKLYKYKQDAVDTVVNFDDPTLLGSAVWNDVNDPHYMAGQIVVFDNTTFNQDIFITYACDDNVANLNYYLELEQVKLDLSEASVATLKDMRGA
jgi:hypothetical protein